MSDSLIVWNLYKKYRNKVKHMVIQAKTSYYNLYLNDDNSKSLWSKVKSFSGLDKKEEVGNIVLDTEKGTVTDPVEIAHHFNKFFKSKVKRLQSNLNPSPAIVKEYVREFLDGRELSEFSFSTVTPNDISRVIRNLNSTKALGCDRIATTCLKKFRNILSPYICHIVNMMICQSEFPQLFKSGIVCPVLKKGNARYVSNYRPVQLNSPISKIAEAVINSQLKQYLEENKLLPRTQNSYRKGYSTFSALADVNTIINEARSRGKQCMILATDMSSAFNLVHIDILDAVLEEYKVDALSRKLIRNYMTGRRVKVRIDNKFSDWEYLESGVGEGTIVGPLFFILILSPLSSAISRAKERVLVESQSHQLNISEEMFDVTTREYADDVSGLLWADNDQILQVVASETMKQFKLFFSAVGMSLNPDKTEILCIRSCPQTLDIVVEGQNESSGMRLLGLSIDCNFDYGSHVANLKKNIAYKLSCLRRLAPYLNHQNLKKVAESLIYSSIMYCLPLFGHVPKFQRTMQRWINSAARIVLKRGARASATQMLQELQWLNVRNLYFVESVCWLSRVISSKSAFHTFGTILNGARKRQRIHNTRDHSILIDLDYNSKYVKQTFVYNAVKILNSLKLQRRIVPINIEYREFVKEEVIKKYGNGNI